MYKIHNTTHGIIKKIAVQMNLKQYFYGSLVVIDIY